MPDQMAHASVLAMGVPPLDQVANIGASEAEGGSHRENLGLVFWGNVACGLLGTRAKEMVFHLAH